MLGKPPGADQISPLFIKSFCLFLLNPITDIINKSFKQCIVSKAWKQANVIPIQKKKGDLNLSNFRPISILPTLSKIMERLVHGQILNHLIYSQTVNLDSDLVFPLKMC